MLRFVKSKLSAISYYLKTTKNTALVAHPLKPQRLFTLAKVQRSSLSRVSMRMASTDLNQCPPSIGENTTESEITTPCDTKHLEIPGIPGSLDAADAKEQAKGANSATDPEAPTSSDNALLSEAPVVSASVENANQTKDEKAEVKAESEPHGNKTKRSKRLRRRGRLHKRQLNVFEQADGEDNPESSSQNKKVKTEDQGESSAYNETDYYTENGLRKVYPYTYTYLCHCKLRWKGQSVIDVLSGEFLVETPEFHAAQIERGLVRVNGKEVKPTRILQGRNELISNCVHRHELPVTGEKINIIADTDDYVVINKPSSIPVHPCGRYRHNTITFILGREHKMENLRTIYRLDRLTSGLLIFGKNHPATQRMMDHIQQRNVSKTYLCRTIGKFPDGVIECEEPMDKVHDKIGTWRVKQGGKPSHTTFERVSFNGDTSVVKCMPRTGRTHQIRVHLQYLGHPIINDPLYNDFVWGPDKGKGGVYGKTDDQLYKDLVSRHCQNIYETGVDDESRTLASSESASELSSHDLRLTPDPNCNFCKKKFKDPSPDQLVMFLHALSYKGPDWQFSTDAPEWASEDWSAASST